MHMVAESEFKNTAKNLDFSCAYGRKIKLKTKTVVFTNVVFTLQSGGDTFLADL